MQSELTFFWSRVKAFFFRKDVYMVSSPLWLRKLFPGCIWDYKTTEKIIYLTFDDGPHPTITPFVLAQLQEHNAKATFFCIGNNVNKFPEQFHKTIAAGHTVGNHTMNHINGWKSTDEEYSDDINKAKVFIKSSLFRPPYGRIKKSQIKNLTAFNNLPVAKARKHQIIMWSVLAGDWDKNLPPEKCFQQIKNNIYPGCIVVLHDSEKAEERLKYVLPKLLKHLTNEGYTMKSIENRPTEIT